MGIGREIHKEKIIDPATNKPRWMFQMKDGDRKVINTFTGLADHRGFKFTGDTPMLKDSIDVEHFAAFVGRVAQQYDEMKPKIIKENTGEIPVNRLEHPPMRNLSEL